MQHQSVTQTIITLLVITVVTFMLRGLPFVIFSGKKEIPKFITYLGKVMPYSVIGMLVVYCFKDVQILSSTYGLPELISVIMIIILHKWRHNLLLSVGAGTVIYMLLVQFVFI